MSNGNHPGSDRRQAILAAAEKVFELRGYAAATMEEVAAEAGIAKGSVYNYFQNKKDLFAQVFAQAATAAEGQMRESLVGCATASAKIERMLEHRFGQFALVKRIGRLVLESWATAAREEQGQLSELMAESFKRIEEIWRGILVEGVERGEFVLLFPAQVAAAMIMSMLDGLGLHLVLGLKTEIGKDFLTAAKIAILGGLTDQGKARTTT